MAKPTSAVIFADRMGDELSPLNQFFPPALLPIAGKSPLEFCLETLCEIGIKRVYLITARHTPLFKAEFPNGDHWGLELSYLSSKGEECPSKLIKRHQSQLENHQLLVRGDILADQNPAKRAELGISIDMLQEGWEQLADQLSWTDLKQTEAQASHLIRELNDLSRLSNMILESKLFTYTPRGILANSRHWLATPDFSQERANELLGNLYVGREAMVHDTAKLSGDIVIERGCFIDRGARLKNAIILPNSYIGQNVSIENAIVCGSLLIDLTQGVSQQIGDPALIAHIEATHSLISTTNSERLVAAGLMISTAWLAYPLAWLTRTKGTTLVAKSEAKSNRGSRKHPIVFEKLAFNSKIGWLTRWPQLIHVIDGDLKLFGSDVESSNQTSVMPDLPLSQGVFGTGDLFPTRDLEPVEKALWGFELANENPGFWSLNLRALKSFFKAPKPSA